jgi:crotonobetainyl-CoA:carnitine CoA-transferase CaiB-like acyl-CoA transferase
MLPSPSIRFLNTGHVKNPDLATYPLSMQGAEVIKIERPG